jgi:predicted transcriptional regulator
MKSEQTEVKLQEVDTFNFKISVDVFYSDILTGEEKLIWMIVNKLNEKNTEYDISVLVDVLAVSKHRIYKMVNHMIRAGFLKKTIIKTEVKDGFLSKTETKSYLIALTPERVMYDDQNNKMDNTAPF